MMIDAVTSTLASYFLYLKALVKSSGVFRQAPNQMPTGEKHLLLITWAFPPVVSGGVYRPLSFVRAAAMNGWNVTVICGPGPAKTDAAGQYLAQQIPTNVSIYRITLPKRRPSHNWFPRVDGGLLNALSIANIALPATRGKTVVIASGPPFCSFVGGWFLSRRLGAPLVLDYRDEWTQCPFEFVTATGHDRTWEKRCLRAAATVLVTTQSFTHQIEESFPFVPEEKIKLIPNGYEPSDFATDEVDSVPSSKAQDSLLTISYLGYLAEHIDPDEFINTFEQALELEPSLQARLRLRFVGKRNPIVEDKFRASRMAELIQFADQVSKQDAARIMRESSAVLLFNPPRLSRYLPGKLFDYVASGASLLVYGSGGEVQKAITRSSTGEVVTAGDPQALAQALVRLLATEDASHNPDRQKWLHAHERGRIAETMLAHLETILDQKG